MLEERNGQRPETFHDRATTHRPRPAQLQSVGREPDTGGLCAALHRQACAEMVELLGGEHGDRSGLVPRARGHRRLDHHQLRLRQCDQRHPGSRRADLPHLPADCLLRRDLWGRHRPAHAWRGLRLHRLDHHIADLRLVHVPVLRHRGGDHVARAGDVLRRPIVHRLCAELTDRHSAGDPRHHLHQPPAALDAADLDRAAPHSVRVHRHGRPQIFRALDRFHRAGGGQRPIVQSHPVRHGVDGGVLADRADRRAGRFPAVSSPAR